MPEVMYSPTSATSQVLVGEDAVENKIKQISQGKLIENKIMSDKVKCLNVSARIRETQQERILQNYKRTNNKWFNVQDQLQKRSGRQRSDLAFNRDLYARMRSEDRQILEEGIDRIKRRGMAYNFIQDLRQYDDNGILSNREVYYNFHDMVAKKVIRPATATPFIRQVSLVQKIDNRENTKNVYDKNYRQNEYFQQVQQQVVQSNLGRISPQENQVGKLSLFGKSKYIQEIQAAQRVGYSKIAPDLVENFSNSQKEHLLSELAGKIQSQQMIDQIFKQPKMKEEVIVQHFDKDKCIR